MIYKNIIQGRFLERPNRFIAYVEVDGRIETVHVKNTGRCRELLVPGAEVYLEQSSNPERKTAYDLIAVKKGERLINMDSQIPNKVVEEWIKSTSFFHDLVLVRPETKYGKSRFDFYIETKEDKIFMEVKGVTLEKDSVVRFPDAPSERAVKHIEELIQAMEDGYKAYIVFVVQMKDVKYFEPNRDTHPEFADVLEKAAAAGVKILCFDCQVTPEKIDLAEPVRVCLTDLQETGPVEVNTAADAGVNTGGISHNLIKIKGIFRNEELNFIPKPLLKWYDSNRRILPWREDPTPYHVWVSEIMLQQTRVEAVKPYYKRFMEALPDIESLSKAEEQSLLKLWEGLGYYNRVRNMQLAARQVMEAYEGRMPGTYEELLKLKGIGSYTAGAIASIAFGRPVPAVDGNVLRVISRYRMDDALISDPKVKARVEQELKEVIPADRPGDFNQAMMELGAMVCLPNGTPKCEECPLKEGCLAYKQGCAAEYPKKADKKARTIEEKTVLIVQDADRAALHKRATKGLLAGMYEFPMMEGYHTAGEVIEYLKKNGLNPLHIKPLEDSKHIFTHKEWHMKGYAIRVDELAPKDVQKEAAQWLFVEPMRTQGEYPLPSAFAAYVPYLNIKLGNAKFE